jgi:predicted glycoside hydrolase/deacetylase ChbG (UPF0249 family)
VIRSLTLIADDFGLAPGVSAAIADLLGAGRLTGTSCMTLFPDWPEQARRIADSRLLGLHLTLTDQPPITTASTLARHGRLPTLSRLLVASTLGDIAEADIHRELDAQLARFADAFGRAPDFFDGHQHVHFLPPVRRWLLARFSRGGHDTARFVRGAPRLGDALASGAVKGGIIAGLAIGFDQAMARGGIPTRGPLLGIYGWRDAGRFEAVLAAALDLDIDDALFMCHPGWRDQDLIDRDPLLETRVAEMAFLRSDRFVALLERHRVQVRRD